jgi:hypothetical protein
MMPDWLNQNFPFIVFPFFLLALCILVSYIIAFCSGWRLLAQRFRLEGPFQGQKWFMRSASMRFFGHYNNCLTIGANNFGLYLRPMILYRAGHHPLLVPWTEITVRPTKQAFLFAAVEFRLGREEDVRFVILQKLADQILAAAGKTESLLPAP